MRKQIFALLFALVVVLSTCSISVSAEDAVLESEKIGFDVSLFRVADSSLESSNGQQVALSADPILKLGQSDMIQILATQTILWLNTYTWNVPSAKACVGKVQKNAGTGTSFTLHWRKNPLSTWATASKVTLNSIWTTPPSSIASGTHYNSFQCHAGNVPNVYLTFTLT